MSQADQLHVRIYEPNATQIRLLADRNGRTPTQEVQFAAKQHLAASGLVFTAKPRTNRKRK